MSETTHLPNVNRVHFSASFAWLVMAWHDLRSEPLIFAAYGAGLALTSLLLVGMLHLTGQLAWFLVLVGGFMIVAPISAAGLFRSALMIENGTRPRLADMLGEFRRIRSDQIMLGVALLFLFGLWFEVAYLIYGLSTSAVHRTMLDFFEFMLMTPEGRQMALLGTIVGGVIAFLAYAIVVISAPMLLDPEMDFFIALITSVRTVITNFPAMLLWAFLIVILTLIGIATAFLGLVIIFPWIGLASWHAYRSLVERPVDQVASRDSSRG